VNNISIDASARMLDFKTLLNDLATLHETLWIEREFYRQQIMEHHIVTPEVLQRRLKEALLDPGVRRIAHDSYLQIWESMHESGVQLLIELLLQHRPTSTKPN
jgi:hypothetical protein